VDLLTRAVSVSIAVTLVLVRRHTQHEQLDKNGRVTAALGLSAVTAAGFRLRDGAGFSGG
jgi:hypothetical protein